MAKAKRIPDYEGVFAVRLRECLNKQGISQNDLAAYIGKTRQAVNYYTLGETVPDADTIILISQKLNVSADYLLGLTNVPTLDITMQEINRLTGLSEKAIKTLIAINEPLSILDLAPKNIIPAINMLLERMEYSKGKQDARGGYFGESTYARDVLPVLSDYLMYQPNKDDVVYLVLPNAKVFTTREDAEAYADTIHDVDMVSISKMRANDFINGTLYNRLIDTIARAKKDINNRYEDK